MIGSTIALHYWVDEDGRETECLPPKPIYDLEFESFEEVEALTAEIVDVLDLVSNKCRPRLRELLVALGDITPEIADDEGE